jgi:hypothetical protein
MLRRQTMYRIALCHRSHFILSLPRLPLCALDPPPATIPEDRKRHRQRHNTQAAKEDKSPPGAESLVHELDHGGPDCAEHATHEIERCGDGAPLARLEVLAVYLKRSSVYRPPDATLHLLSRGL